MSHFYIKLNRYPFYDSFDLTKAGITRDCNRHTLDGGGVYSSKDRLTIKNCVIRNCSEGICIGGEGSIIRSNTICQCQCDCIMLRSGSCNNLIIEDNTVRDSKDTGISLSSCSSKDNIIIRNNRLLNNYYYGIYSEGGSMSNSVIENNTMTHCGIFFGDTSGSNNTISMNIFSGTCFRFDYLNDSNITWNEGVGCSMMVSGDRNTISNNNCSMSDGKGLSMCGDNNTITNNDFSGHGGDGICLENANNNYVSNNRVVNNSHYGIGDVYSFSNTIVNNDIRDNDVGIFVYGSFFQRLRITTC